MIETVLVYFLGFRIIDAAANIKLEHRRGILIAVFIAALSSFFTGMVITLVSGLYHPAIHLTTVLLVAAFIGSAFGRIFVNIEHRHFSFEFSTLSVGSVMLAESFGVTTQSAVFFYTSVSAGFILFCVAAIPVYKALNKTCAESFRGIPLLLVISGLLALLLL